MSAMTQVEIGWLAGLFEGEGTISIPRSTPKKSRSGVALRVVSTDCDVIERVRDVTGVGYVYASMPPLRKPYWTWVVQLKRDVARLLLAIYPLMGTRRQHKIAEAAEVLARTKTYRLAKDRYGR
jgi:hypothetical protein